MNSSCGSYEVQFTDGELCSADGAAWRNEVQSALVLWKSGHHDGFVENLCSGAQLRQGYAYCRDRRTIMEFFMVLSKPLIWEFSTTTVNSMIIQNGR